MTFGPRLAEYLERQLRARGLTVNAWTDRTPGVTGADLTRWRVGTEPTIVKYRAVADGLDLPMVQVLLAAGVLTSEDTDGATVTEPPAPSIDVAIAQDPALSELQRRSLADILAALRRAETGAAGTATSGRVLKRTPRART